MQDNAICAHFPSSMTQSLVYSTEFYSSWSYPENRTADTLEFWWVQIWSKTFKSLICIQLRNMWTASLLWKVYIFNVCHLWGIYFVGHFCNFPLTCVYLFFSVSEDLSLLEKLFGTLSSGACKGSICMFLCLSRLAELVWNIGIWDHVSLWFQKTVKYVYGQKSW